jgi:hypothetical protein
LFRLKKKRKKKEKTKDKGLTRAFSLSLFIILFLFTRFPPFAEQSPFLLRENGPALRCTYVQSAAIIRYIMHNACMYRRDDEKCSFVAKMSRQAWQIIPRGAAASYLLRDNVHEITRTQVFWREIRGETVTLSRPRYIVFINIYKSVSRADEHRGTRFRPSGIDLSHVATSGRCAAKAGEDSKG